MLRLCTLGKVAGQAAITTTTTTIDLGSFRALCLVAAANGAANFLRSRSEIATAEAPLSRSMNV